MASYMLASLKCVGISYSSSTVLCFASRCYLVLDCGVWIRDSVRRTGTCLYRIIEWWSSKGPIRPVPLRHMNCWLAVVVELLNRVWKNYLFRLQLLLLARNVGTWPQK